jgi:4-amino-4-deoxy-L-arabinose transferase-like glycosyltransferase
MEFFRNNRANAIAVFFASVLIILLFWALLPERFAKNESTDYFRYYEPIARSITRGEGITQNGEFAYINPPGYPFILASIFELAQMLNVNEETMNAGFILLCAGMSAVFIFLLAERIWGVAGGWISAMFFVTYPFFLWLTKQPSTEIPFILFFYAALYAFWRGIESTQYTKRIFFLTGVVAGSAMLIRAAAFGIGIIMAFLIFPLKKNTLPAQKAVLALMLISGNLLTILPWETWVYAKTGKVILVGNTGAYAIRDGLTFGAISKNYRAQFNLPEDVLSLQREFASEGDQLLSMELLAKSILRHVEDNPAAMIKLAFIKAARSWYGTDSGRNEAPIAYIQMGYAAIVLSSTYCLWRKRNAPGLLLFVYAFAFYFWGMTVLALSILRYITPIAGLPALLVPSILLAKRKEP